MYATVTPVLIDKWRPPTADAVWVGGRVYLKQILQAFPLSPLLLPRFYFFALLFTSYRSRLCERLEQANPRSTKRTLQVGFCQMYGFFNQTPRFPWAPFDGTCGRSGIYLVEAKSVFLFGYQKGQIERKCQSSF